MKRLADGLLACFLLAILIASCVCYTGQFETVQEDGPQRRVTRKNAFGQLHGTQTVHVDGQLLMETHYRQGTFCWSKRYLPDHVEHTFEGPDYQLVTEWLDPVTGQQIGRWK